MKEKLKGRSGSFIAYGDPWILYTASGTNERTAVTNCCRGLVLINPRAVSVNQCTQLYWGRLTLQGQIKFDQRSKHLTPLNQHVHR